MLPRWGYRLWSLLDIWTWQNEIKELDNKNVERCERIFPHFYYRGDIEKYLEKRFLQMNFNKGCLRQTIWKMTFKNIGKNAEILYKKWNKLLFYMQKLCKAKSFDLKNKIGCDRNRLIKLFKTSGVGTNNGCDVSLFTWDMERS